MRRFLLLAAAITMLAAACGDDDTTTGADATIDTDTEDTDTEDTDTEDTDTEDTDTGADDFDFHFAGVPGPSVAEVAGTPLDGHSFRGGIINEGVDSLRLYVNDVTEEAALELCQRVAEHVAHHPEAEGEGELSVGSGAETEGEVVLVATTVSPGDPGSCERS